MKAAVKSRASPERDNRSAFVFCITGLILVPPSFLLPFVTLNKFGNTHVCHLMNTADGLWQGGMPILGSWVFFCGMLAPLILLVLMAALSAQYFNVGEELRRQLVRAGGFITDWAMPEVLVLGVLVSFFKVKDLVNVKIGSGFWCYVGVALMLVLTLQNFVLEFETSRKEERKKHLSERSAHE